MVGGEDGGVEDAGHVEPHVVGPDPLAGVDPVDAEALGGGRAEHGDGFLGGRRVEVAALGDGGADGGQQAEAGGLDGEGVGVDGGDERAAVDVAGDRSGLLHLGHPVDAADHGRGRCGQLGRAGRRGSGRSRRPAGWCPGPRSRSAVPPRRTRRARGRPRWRPRRWRCPSAESPARSLRVRSPTVDRRPRSEGRSFRTARVSVGVMAGGPACGWGRRDRGSVLVRSSGRCRRRSGRRASRSGGPCGLRCLGRG